MPSPSQVSLDRLLSFLNEDSNNLTLLADAAAAAFDLHEFRLCTELLTSYENLQPLAPELVNLRGLCALSEGRFDDAQADFRRLVEHDANPILGYNLAYASAMCGSFELAANLDAICLESVPGAALLKLKALHRLGHFDVALQMAPLADQADSPPGLAGAYATLLFDLGDLESARRYASRSPQSADSLVITGLAELEAGKIDQAVELLTQAAARNPREARATLGLGLCLLAKEQYLEAATTLDQAAEQLADHAGSWLAAGWAWLFDSNLTAACERFQRAATLDRGFAEAQGSLAVAYQVAGYRDKARHHADIALRLDSACLSASLARTIENETTGRIEYANEIRDAVMHRPLRSTGRTLAQALTVFGLKRKQRPS